MASPTQWAWVWVNSRSWWWTESWLAAIHGVAKSRTRLSDWTELSWIMNWAVCLVTQLCPTLCNPMDCGPPGSSVHGDSPGKNTRVGCYALLQEIFPTQGSNPGLPHCRQILYHLSHQGSPRILEWVVYPFSRGLPDPRIEPRSPALQADSLPAELSGKPKLSPAATAKSLQLCPTLCDHIDGSPPGSPVPGILQARTLEWVAISFSRIEP